MSTNCNGIYIGNKIKITVLKLDMYTTSNGMINHQN